MKNNIGKTILHYQVDTPFRRLLKKYYFILTVMAMLKVLQNKLIICQRKKINLTPIIDIKKITIIRE